MRSLGAEVINDAVLLAGFDALARAIQKGDLRAFEFAIRLLYGPLPTLRKSAAAALSQAPADMVRIYLPFNGDGAPPAYVEDESGQIGPAKPGPLRQGN